MGEETQLGTLQININGEWHELSDEIPTMNIEFDCESAYVPSELSFTVPFKYKNMHRMSRKRLVKLLMGRGVQRNRANAIACIVNFIGQPYKEAGNPFNLFFLLNEPIVISAVEE